MNQKVYRPVAGTFAIRRFHKVECLADGRNLCLYSLHITPKHAKEDEDANPKNDQGQLPPSVAAHGRSLQQVLPFFASYRGARQQIEGWLDNARCAQQYRGYQRMNVIAPWQETNSRLISADSNDQENAGESHERRDVAKEQFPDQREARDRADAIAGFG